MPIEIKQLEIRGKVFANDNSGESGRQLQVNLDKLKREIIESCVERFERYVENKKDR
jgi:hypothetical protein